MHDSTSVTRVPIDGEVDWQSAQLKYPNSNQPRIVVFGTANLEFLAYTCTCGRLTGQNAALRLEEYCLRSYGRFL
jgi:hypothetical protein